MYVWRLPLLLFGFARVASQQPTVSTPSACDQEADQTCETPFNNHLSSAAADNQRVCLAADVMIGCTAQTAQSCDLLEAAQVAENVKNKVIAIYGPNSTHRCQLSNASLPAYQHSACSSPLVQCFGILAQADLQAANNATDPLKTCAFYNSFTRCLAAEFSACDHNVTTYVTNRAREAEVKYNSQPYLCSEKTAAGHVTVNETCDQANALCSASLSRAESTKINDQQSIFIACVNYDEYILCAENLLGSCDNATLDEVNRTVQRARKKFNGDPYFCEPLRSASTAGSLTTVPTQAIAVTDKTMTNTVIAATVPTAENKTEDVGSVVTEQNERSNRDNLTNIIAPSTVVVTSPTAVVATEMISVRPPLTSSASPTLLYHSHGVGATDSNLNSTTSATSSAPNPITTTITTTAQKANKKLTAVSGLGSRGVNLQPLPAIVIFFIIAITILI